MSTSPYQVHLVASCVDTASLRYFDLVIAYRQLYEEKCGRRHGWKTTAAKAFGVSPSYISKIESVEDGGEFQVGNRAMRDAIRRIHLPPDFFESDGLPPGELRLTPGLELAWDPLTDTVRSGLDLVATQHERHRRDEWERVLRACQALTQSDGDLDLREVDELADAVLNLSFVRFAQRMADSSSESPYVRVALAMLLAAQLQPVAEICVRKDAPGQP